MTPNIAIVHVQNSCWRNRGIKLWIPLFLLWIPAILLSPLILLLVLCACFVGINPFQAIGIFWNVVCSLPGTHVHVRADGNTVLVRIL